MAAYGLYTHIASNKFRSMLLLGGLFLLVYVMVFAAALLAEVALNSNRPFETYITLAAHDLVKALPLATIAAAAWIVIAYFFHQNIIDAVTGGHDVTRQEQPRLYNLLENLCISRGIPMPKLKIVDSPALNAFATGLNRKQYSISFTTGLMDALNDREMEAVLGHELTHIRNGDVQLLVIAVVIAGVIGFFAELFFRIFFNSGVRYSGGGRSSSSSSDGDKKGGGAFAIVLLAIALIGVAWGLSLVVRFALSRSRELLADAGSVELTKDPDAMISALRKIEGRGELPGATSAVMEMCIDNPREGFADLFATHPSVDSRVKALVKYAGGRDPGPMALPGGDAETGDSAPQSGDTSLDARREPPHGGPWGSSPQPTPSPAGSILGPWGRR
ncbi:MAG: M48 family metallopeptidase [Afipia sp.]|nr:M48 family metallopeptidase [Afipia sp.]